MFYGKNFKETLFIQSLDFHGASSEVKEFIEVFWRSDFGVPKRFIGHISNTPIKKIEDWIYCGGRFTT